MRSSRVSMTGISGTTASFCGRARQFGFKKTSDFFFAQTFCFQLPDGAGDDDLSAADFVGARPGGDTGSNERPRAVAEFYDAFVFQFAVDLGDCIGIDGQLLSQWAHARQLVAGDVLLEFDSADIDDSLKAADCSHRAATRRKVSGKD